MDCIFSPTHGSFFPCYQKLFCLNGSFTDLNRIGVDKLGLTLIYGYPCFGQLLRRLMLVHRGNGLAHVISYRFHVHCWRGRHDAELLGRVLWKRSGVVFKPVPTGTSPDGDNTFVLVKKKCI